MGWCDDGDWEGGVLGVELGLWLWHLAGELALDLSRIAHLEVM